MPYTVIANKYLVTSGSEAMFNLKQTLSGAGWKVSGSSNAVTFSANSDILISGAMLETSGAWFTVVPPDDTRQWSFQRGANNQTWTIIRSKDGMSGSVGATTPPVDGRAATLVNNTTFFSANIGNWLVSVVSSSVAEQISSSFFAFNVPIGGGNVFTALYDEALLTGSYNPLDQDPYISFTNYLAIGWSAITGYNWDSSGFSSLGSYRHMKRVRHNMSSPANQTSAAMVYYSTQAGNIVSPPSNTSGGGTFTANPYDSKEIIWLVGYGRGADSTPTYSGVWGYGANIRAATVGASRANGQTMDTGTRYYIYCAGWWFPWDPSTPL